MAQELIDKIREQAQARGLDPDIAVQIARAESSLDPSAKAKTSSAQGLFQVIDKTWKEYGGKPGQKGNPDENIRVGLNILQANQKALRETLGRDPSASELYAAHFLGATGAKGVLLASDDTPVSQLLSERAVRANPGLLKDKNVGQLRAALEAKMTMPGSRPTAQAPAPAVAPMPAAAAGAPKRPTIPSSKIAADQLGTGYQAALALSFLADEDEDTPLTREQWQERQERESPTAAQMLASTPKNALAQINWDESALFPVKMADGGDVDLEKVQSEARQGEAYRQMEQYLKARDAMPNIVAKKLPEPINAQFTAMRMPAGSGRIELHNDPDVLRVIGPSVMAHELAHAAERQMGQQASEESSVFGGKSQFAEAYDKLVGRGPFVSGKKRAEFARKIAPDWAAFNREYRASPAEIGAHGVGAFAPSKNMQDSAPLHVDATAATEFQILLDLAQRNAKNKATGAVRIPNFLKQVMGFADGGNVAPPTQEEIDAAMRPMDIRFAQKSGIGRRNTTKPGEIDAAIVQGVSEMPYNLFGSVADVGALALRPFGYTNPTPFLGSEHLKQLATRAGIRQAPPTQPTARAFYELGQLGSSLVNPAAPVRAAAAAGQAAGRTARQAMQDFQAYNRQLAAPGASYAVKPKGGVFAMTTEPSATAATKSNLDELLKSYMAKAETKAPEGSREAVMEFLRTKAPKYFTSTYGTASDPLREALRSVRVEPIGRETSKMPPYMIDAARDPQARGHAQAAIDLERAYDEMTGISGMAYAAPGPDPLPSGARARQMLEAMGREGVPVEARNPVFVTTHQVEDFQRYPASSRIMRGLVESQDTLPPHLQQALRTEEIIYDVKPDFDMLRPENVVEALSSVPANKLKNMSFPEALIQGLQATAPLRDYKAAIEIAGRGGAVPPAALMKFTAPVTPTVGGQWVRLTEPIATKMEGKLMNHSVGGYAEGESYGTAYTGLPYGGKKAFEEGLAQVYSLRDRNGKPMVTVEVANKGTKEEPKLLVTQVRGRFNSEPSASAQKAVFDLFDKLDEGGKLKEIRQNSYSVSPTGERLDQGSQVDWGRLYEEWKSDFAE